MDNSQKNIYLIIGAIIVAALIIAGAVIYTNGGESTADKSDDNIPPAKRETETKDPVDLAIKEGEYIRGNPEAKVTIFEYSDYECPFCARFHPTLKQILTDYPEDVNWVYRHFPLDSIHPQARPAAIAAECAGEQGKFWEFSDALFENQANLSSDLYGQLAGDLGLNTAQFNECVSSGKYADKVESDFQEGISVGVTGTPGSFINGVIIPGALPYESVKAEIDKALAQ